MRLSPDLRRLQQVAWPILLSLVAQNVINVTDTAFLGHVGDIELGASAIGGLFYICCFTLAFGFSTGAQIIIARRNGEGAFLSIGPVAIQTLLFLLTLAVALFLTLSRFLPDILPGIISSPHVAAATEDYLRPRLYGLFFSFANVVFRAFFVGIMRTPTLTYNALLMALANVALDRALIFGIPALGIPAMGIRGAAIASVAAEGLSLAFFLLYTFLTVDTGKYGLRKLPRFDFSLLSRILSVSFYTMLQHFVSITTFFIFFLIIERLGERTLAAANIARSVYILLFVPVQALATAVNTLVSNAIGEGRTDRAPAIIRQTTLVSIGLVTLAAVPVCLFPEAVLSLYTPDAGLAAHTVTSLYVISLAMLFNAAAAVVFNGLTGAGHTRRAFVIELITLAAYYVYVYVLGVYLRMPLPVCFTGEIVYAIILLLLSIRTLQRHPPRALL
jgi:putative MATE family efflux protein